jgi:aldose 1-epimerase
VPASVRVHRWRGVAAVTLASGELAATFVPEMNLLGASLRLGGEEFLALPGGVGAYRRVRTTGLPLLAPWANRLSGWAYQAGRLRVDLDGLDLYTDPNGLPIHGTMSARERWDVRAVSTGGRVARLRAGFAYAGAELLAAFPFPHRLETAIDVDGRSLSVATTIRPSGDRAVPVSFGYHPYFRLPGGRRPAWRLLLPRRRGFRSAPSASGPGRRSVAAFHLAAARYRATALPTASSLGAPGPASSSSSSSPQSIRAASVRSRTWGPRLLEK